MKEIGIKKDEFALMDGDGEDLLAAFRVAPDDLHIEISVGGIHQFKIGVVVRPHIERRRKSLDVTSHQIEFAIADVPEMNFFHACIIAQMF